MDTLKFIKKYGKYMADLGTADTRYKGSRQFRKGFKGKSRRVSRRKGKKSSAKRVRRLEKRVKNLADCTDAGTGILTYRRLSYEQKSVASNNGLTDFYGMNTAGNIQLALDQLRYYDPQNPSALVTVDFDTGTYSKQVSLLYSSISVRMRANYEVPVRYAVYYCTVKADTNQNPDVLMDSSAVDQTNIADGDSILLYPSDMLTLNKLFNVKLLRKGVLHPGRVIDFRHSVPQRLKYDPSEFDIHNLQYQTRWKSGGIMIRTFGCLAHDSTLAEVGRADTMYDLEIKRTMKVSYDAGANINFIYVDDEADTFTNAPYVCNPVESTNQRQSLT